MIKVGFIFDDLRLRLQTQGLRRFLREPSRCILTWQKVGKCGLPCFCLVFLGLLAWAHAGLEVGALNLELQTHVAKQQLPTQTTTSKIKHHGLDLGV